MRAEDAIPYVDENGITRYRRPTGEQAQMSRRKTRRPKTLSDKQIDGIEPIHPHDLQAALNGVSPDKVMEMPTSSAGMTVRNTMKGKTQGYKKRHGPGQPRSLDVLLRRAKALELRRAGFTWEEIAQRKSLGYTTGNQVSRDVYRLLQAMIDTPAQEVLALELSRLDAITQVLWQQVRTGDLNAINTLYRAMQMRQDLLGLRSLNIKHEVVTVSDLDREIERLTHDLRENQEKVDGHPESISDHSELLEAQRAAGLLPPDAMQILNAANGTNGSNGNGANSPHTNGSGKL